MERDKANLMMGSNKRVKDSEAHYGDSDSCGLIVWPPKNYNCSFCKREFRSAQALGGHMNVHRRDRARLRMLPPPARPLLDYRNPNPNPSFASSLVSPSIGINSLSSSPSSSVFTKEEKKRLLDCPQQINALKLKKNTRAAFGAGKLKGHYGQKSDIEFLKRKEELAISLDLEMGLKDTKETVDLELRLGYH